MILHLSLLQTCTVPLKSKLTLETRTSRLDPRASMFETFEDRVSSIESRVSRIESRGSRNRVFSNMQKLERVSRKRFQGNDLFLEGRIIQYCSHLKCKCLAPIVITWKHSTIVDGGLNVNFFSETTCVLN